MFAPQRLRVGPLVTLALFIIYTLNTYLLDARQTLSGWNFSSSFNGSETENNSSTTGNAGSKYEDQVDWSRYAYTQYATNSPYLCNSVMLFATLHSLGSRADRLLMFPEIFDPNNPSSDPESQETQLLIKARDLYDVKLQPVQVQSKSGTDPTWAESYTKLLAFNQTQYDRVLSLDSDSTVLQPMDELFLLPSAPVAMPRAYWIDPDPQLVLSSQIVLIEPSEKEFERIMNAIHNAKTNDYDMEIVNDLYRLSALIIPHRPYDLLTGEFRSKNHSRYLGSEVDEWDVNSVLKEAKFLHFSDWPTPKPWLVTIDQIGFEAPECLDIQTTSGEDNESDVDCISMQAWFSFYEDFAQRRQEVCGIGVRGYV